MEMDKIHKLRVKTNDMRKLLEVTLTVLAFTR